MASFGLGVLIGCCEFGCFVIACFAVFIAGWAVCVGLNLGVLWLCG